ncbi:MAG: NAD(P)-dependent alcohol dehydrogenase, partial [Anaerolineales bacterium]
GAPDALRLSEVEKPVPQAGQVLVKVRVAAANPLDFHGVRGEPAVARLMTGLLKPKDARLGADLAGVVEAVGGGVTEFRPGDEVFGMCAGAFAEYALARETRLALKPAHISFEAAAASPVVGFTALQGLRGKGQVKAGQKVLINGASGGVGTFAVQLAKAAGAEVTGVCSTRNLELVRSLGADHVIDYTREDFTRTGQAYDLIYDAVGNRSVADYKRALSARGRCVIAGFTSFPRLLEHLLVGPALSRAGGKTVAMQSIAQGNKQDLLVIKELLETGQVVSVIDRCYPLCEAGQAVAQVEGGHARGKVIVVVDQKSSL